MKNKKRRERIASKNSQFDPKIHQLNVMYFSLHIDLILNIRPGQPPVPASWGLAGGGAAGAHNDAGPLVGNLIVGQTRVGNCLFHRNVRVGRCIAHKAQNFTVNVLFKVQSFNGAADVATKALLDKFILLANAGAAFT